MIVRLTVFPIPLHGAIVGRQSAAYILSKVNLVPFGFGRLFDSSPVIIFREVAGNILLTLPFGFCLPFLLKTRGWQPVWMAIGSGLAIETTQLIVSLAIGGVYRGVDINDVLLNTSGVLIGYAVFKVIARMARFRLHDTGEVGW